MQEPTTAPDRVENGRRAAPRIDRQAEAQPIPKSGRLDLIACDGCGRSFATADGPAMLGAIKGPCPTCGGEFRLRELDD